MKRWAVLTAITLGLLSSTAGVHAQTATKPQPAQRAQTAKFDSSVHGPRGAAALLFTDAKNEELLRARVEQNVFIGTRELTSHNFVAAEASYKKALAEDPNNVQARAGLGMALTKQFKLDGADEQFNKTLALDPDNALAHAGRALSMMSRLQSSNMTYLGNAEKILSEAEQEANTAIRSNYSLPEAHFALGSIYKERGDFNKSIGEFAVAAQLDPNYSEAFSAMGTAKLLAGRTAEAIPDLKQAIALDSGNSGAHFGLGSALLESGQVNDAINELNISLSQMQNSAPAHFMMGEAYKAQGNSLAAVKEYQESLKIKPENAGAHLKIAEVYEGRGDLEHAIAQMHSAEEVLSDNMQIRQKLGDLNLKLEKADDAIANYKAVLAVQPANEKAKKGLVDSYSVKAQKEVSKAFFNSNGYEGAEQALSEAIKLKPNDFELRLANTKLRKMSGRLFKADEVAEPTNDGDVIDYAEALITKGKFKEALKKMDQVILKTNDAKQLCAIGEVAVMIKDLESAEGAFRKGLRLGAKDRAERGLVQIHKIRDEATKDLALANDFAERKQWQAALTKFYDAMKKDPRDPVARKGLAKVLDHVDDPSSQELRESINQWSAYMELEPALPASERGAILRHIDKLQAVAEKLEIKEKAHDNEIALRRQRLVERSKGRAKMTASGDRKEGG